MIKFWELPTVTVARLIRAVMDFAEVLCSNPSGEQCYTCFVAFDRALHNLAMLIRKRQNKRFHICMYIYAHIYMCVYKQVKSYFVSH